jgi:hypothetical protein
VKKQLQKPNSGLGISIPKNPVFWILTGVVVATELALIKQGIWWAALILTIYSLAVLTSKDKW